jgi:hypothetical protein
VDASLRCLRQKKWATHLCGRDLTNLFKTLNKDKQTDQMLASLELTERKQCTTKYSLARRGRKMHHKGAWASETKLILMHVIVQSTMGRKKLCATKALGRLRRGP